VTDRRRKKPINEGTDTVVVIASKIPSWRRFGRRIVLGMGCLIQESICVIRNCPSVPNDLTLRASQVNSVARRACDEGPNASQ
jgi:hypothetical protein